MACEMVQEAEDCIPSLEEEIKLLLIPADPEDAKNVVMEIRGGTGGLRGSTLCWRSLPHVRTLL